MNEYGKKVAKKMEDYMGNPDSVSEEINDIQNALHGVDVRGALAAGVKKSFSKSESAEGISKNTEQRQDAVEQQFDDVLNEWTSDKPISNEETIAARTNRETGDNYTTLGQRLDAENKKVNAQLAETGDKVERFSNAEYPLTIRTYEGYNQVVHPDVKYFNNPWNGYRYWMAYTPYPWTNDFYENPSIAASEDGIKWITPEGMVNPLDDVTEEENENYGIHLSDAALVFNDDTNELECWYRWTNESTRQEKYYRKTTTDGINWGPKELVYEKDGILVSPTIIYENGKYRMWAVASYESYNIVYTETTTPTFLSSWSSESVIPVTFKEGERRGTIWHIHIYKESNNLYHLTWNEKTGSIFWATSVDGNSFGNCQEIMKPSKGEGRWDNNHLYRPSLIKVNDLYRLYYSALGLSPGRWYVGLVEGNGMTTLSSSSMVDRLSKKHIKDIEGINATYDVVESKRNIIRTYDGSDAWLRMIEAGRAGAGLKLGDKTGWIKVVDDSGNFLGYLEANALKLTSIYPATKNAGITLHRFFRVIDDDGLPPMFKLLYRNEYGVGATIDSPNTFKIIADNEIDDGHIEVGSVVLSGDSFKQVSGSLRHNKQINKIQALSGNYWHNLNNYNPSVPSTPTSPGTTGDYAVDENYLYVCYAAGRWIRIKKDDTWQ